MQPPGKSSRIVPVQLVARSKGIINNPVLNLIEWVQWRLSAVVFQAPLFCEIIKKGIDQAAPRWASHNRVDDRGEKEPCSV